MTSQISESFKAPLTGGVRFAPSPTGRFHIGNLRTAWISHQWAIQLGKPWVVRVEDIDQPRVLPGAQEQQLKDMKSLGMTPDVLLVQSHFRRRHWELFVEGVRSGKLYPCDCSRREVQTALAGIASAPHDGLAPVYSGHCRPLAERKLEATDSIAWRFRMPNESGHDDFIVARSAPNFDQSGLPEKSTFVPAYQWACAIDDYDGGYDLLVRGIDLEPAAAVQRAIQKWLSNLNGTTVEPAVFHTSLVVQNDGHRLEKRTKGVTLPELAEVGITENELIRVFDKSFDRSLLNHAVFAGALIREAGGKLTLDDLGLPARS